MTGAEGGRRGRIRWKIGGFRADARVVCLSLKHSLGDDAGLVGVGEGHVGHRLDLVEEVIEESPVHRGLEDRADAACGEAAEEAGEAAQAVGFDAALLHGRSGGVQNMDDAIALVVINAGE